MSTLIIRKKSLKTWLHTDSILGDFIISKFYFNADGLNFQIVEQGQSKRVIYTVTDITLYDDTDESIAETFTTILELSLRLENLNYPAFYIDGEITSIANLIEAGNNITITGEGTENSPYIINSTGGGGSQNLQEVTDIGNTTDKNIELTSDNSILFGNGSRLIKGTTNAYNGGEKGIALKCSVDYEMKWEAGRLYVMEQDGFTIREVSHNFTNVPTTTDDETKGFVVDTHWILDNGDVYKCNDATTDNAVWEFINTGTIPTLQQVTNSGRITADTIIFTDPGLDYKTEINTNGVLSQNIITGVYVSLNSEGSLDLGNANGNESSLKNTNVTNDEVILEFPDKPNGSYTIATTDDFPTLQDVVTEGNTYTDTNGTITIGSYLFLNNTLNTKYLTISNEGIEFQNADTNGYAIFDSTSLSIYNGANEVSLLSTYVSLTFNHSSYGRTSIYTNSTKDPLIEAEITLPSHSGTLALTSDIPSGSGGIPNTTASGTDTYTAAVTGVTSYTNGDAYLVRFTNGNTTGATLNINSLGAITLYRNNDGAIIGGDIQNGAEMLCVYNSTLNAFQCIGTSPNTIIAYVTNADSVTLTKGMPVYAFGGTGDRMIVKRAYNTGDSTSAQTVGIVLSTSIATNQKGIIILQGLLDGLSILPTSTFADGDTIYLGATAGTITNVKPYAPNHLVYLGVVTTASAGAAGRMYVKVQNGYELDELHNVQAQSPSNNDTLYFDNSVSQWKTASISTILGFTPENSANKSTSTSDSASSTKFPVWSAILSYFSASQIRSILGISTLSGSNTGDQDLSVKVDKLKSFNRQTSSYTLVLGDADKLVEMNVATANNLTIPLNSSVAYSIGTQIDIVQYGAGQTTIVPTSGVTIRSANSWVKINARYGAVTLTKVGTDEWYLWGNLNA